MTEAVPKHEKRFLRYDFTATETHDLSLEMANKTREIAQVEAEKKSATSQFKSRIGILQTSINSLAEKVSSGYEMREVTCNVVYNKPKQGMKTLTRTDTGKKFEEKMSDSDWNLWNQSLDEPDPVKKEKDKGLPLIEDAIIVPDQEPLEEEATAENDLQDGPF